jgi:hypothetical protein
VRPQLEAAIEPDEQVLALRLDRIDASTDDPPHLGHGTGTLRPRGEDVAPDEVRPQSRRGPMERVALRHGSAT